jgi:hypothetical protein
MIEERSPVPNKWPDVGEDLVTNEISLQTMAGLKSTT